MKDDMPGPVNCRSHIVDVGEISPDTTVDYDPKPFIPPCMGNACPKCRGRGWTRETSTAETKIWLETKCPECKGRGFI